MVELRKRPAPPATNAPAQKKSAPASSEKKGPIAKVKEVVEKVVKGAAPTKAAKGDTIDFAGFGGEVETNDGVKTSLADLVEQSKSGIVLFTYPKASTPGCKLCDRFCEDLR